MCHTYKLILSSLIPVTSIDSFLSQSMCFNKNNPSSPHLLLQPPMMTSDIQLSWSLQLQSPFSRPLCFPRSPRGEHQGLRGGSDSVAPRVWHCLECVTGSRDLRGKNSGCRPPCESQSWKWSTPSERALAQSKVPGTGRGCRALLPWSSAPYTQPLHTCPHGIAQPLTGTHLPRSIVTKSDLPLCDVSKSNATTLNVIHSLS